MVIKKTWTRHKRYGGTFYRYKYTGYFLVGFIPLFINREEEAKK